MAAVKTTMKDVMWIKAKLLGPWREHNTKGAPNGTPNGTPRETPRVKLNQG